MITFPWVPALNRGRHKLVSKPTVCRKPLSNSLVEDDSSLCKTILLTLMWGLRAHIAIGWN